MLSLKHRWTRLLPFRSLLFHVNPVIWLLLDTVSSEGFSLAWHPLCIFKYRCCDGQFPGFSEYIFPQLQTCTALVLSADCTECYCSSNIVIFEVFLIFNFPFFQFWTIASSLFLGKYYSIFDVVTSIAFNIHRIVYYNHRCLMISVNNAKHIHLLPIFSTFQGSSYCK